MSTLVESAEALAVDVSCTEVDLSVVLSDGRTVAVPLAWFPRLVRASAKQRADWEFIGGGVGIHWEAVDDDISVASLLQPENFMRLPDQARQQATSAVARRPGMLAPLTIFNLTNHSTVLYYVDARRFKITRNALSKFGSGAEKGQKSRKIEKMRN